MPSETNKPSLAPVILGLVGLLAFIAFIVWVVVSTPPQRGKQPLEQGAPSGTEQPENAPAKDAEGEVLNAEEQKEPDERQGRRDPAPPFEPRTQQGLRLTLRHVALGHRDTVRARRAALALQEGAAPSPLSRPGLSKRASRAC